MPYGDNAAASAAAHYAREQGFETAYLMISHDIGSYSIATLRYFGETFEHLGGKVLGEMNWNWGTTEYSPQVSEFASMDPMPDVIFSAFIMPDGGVFARQLHTAGVSIPIYATDGMDNPILIEVGGEGAELVTFTTHGFPTEGSKLKWFYDECISRGFDSQSAMAAASSSGETRILMSGSGPLNAETVPPRRSVMPSTSASSGGSRRFACRRIW